MEDEIYNEFEKEVHEVLFNQKQGDLKQKIDFLNSFYLKESSNEFKLPSTNEFMEKYNTTEKGKKLSTKQVNTMNKKILIALGAAALIGVALFLGLGTKKPEVASGNELKVKLTFVIGEVKVKSNASEEGTRPEVGALLVKNQILITGDKGTAELQFSNGSSLRVRANTEVAIKTLIEKDGKVTEEVSLKKGMIVANINKQKQTDDFHVITPTVIAGVRGTRFLVVVDPNKNKEEITKVSVLDGSVGITKHRDEVALTPEPILVLDGKDSATEITRGGDFKKDSITTEDVSIIEGTDEVNETPKPETEQSLYAKYGRMEILSLDGGKKITGVITSMDDNTFTVHTPNGFVNVDRKKVISHDSKQIK